MLHRGNSDCFAPKILLFAFLCLLPVLIFSLDARAAALEGTSSTYLQSREDIDRNKLLPVYEYLDLSVQDLGTSTVSAHLGGWFRYDLRDDSFGRKTNNDLQYAFLTYRAKESNATVNLGRVMVFEGVAAERVDGIYARTDLKAGFGISAYGGAPVLTNEGDDSGTNTIYGARVSHQVDGLYTIGLSYLKEEKNSAAFREEEGVDLWLRPVKKVEVSGRSSYNANTEGWAQHTYNVLFGPFDKLRINAEASHVNYLYFFDGTTNGAFVFTPGGPIDPNEKLDLYGAAVSYEFTDKVSASVDYKQYTYAIAGSANYVGANVRYTERKSYAAGASLHRMDGEADRLRYSEYRAYASKKYGKYDLTLDLLDVKYDAPINGVSNAYSATLAAGYETTERLLLGADVEYSKNPDFDRDVRLLVKAVYRFDTGTGSVKPEKKPEQKAAEPQAQAPAAVDKPVAPATQPPATADKPAAPATEQQAPAGGAEQGARKEGTQ